MTTCEYKYIQAIVDADLSPVTRKVYLQRLKVMMEENAMNVQMLVSSPDEVLEWIYATYDSHQTQKSYISAILAVFRHNAGLKQDKNAAYKKWYNAFADVHQHIEDRYKRNEPTQKQKDVYVPFLDVVKARDSLPKGSHERLLFAFYTYLPPLRCDFNRTYIYTSPVPETPESNYIVVDASNQSCRLVLNEFKTRKTQDGYEKELPPELCEELHSSLHMHPRVWLFTDKKGKPFTAKTYTQWANRIIARVVGKRMTVSMLRHSFINSLNFNTLTVAEKEAIAKDMAHTIGTQDRYRLIF